MYDNEVGIVIGTLFFIIMFVTFIILAISIPVIIAQWKFFKKAGKNGWEAIVPFYNTWVLIEISGLNWWYFLISVGLPIVGMIGGPIFSLLLSLGSYYINFIIYYNIAKKTKQNEILYGVLGLLVPYVAILILGFSKTITYDKNIEVSPNGVF